ncbi:hypothetical protein NHX12_005295 [Muraenolepis orangiensis]|uniref:Uncharacterized protein n=1 Tax=Muraenolepis orangiensis TaxID=630683 RepID=A0A9Q0DRB0_9TELE|nr:hypothetical protein NHX12_005295 [Muraenolepis orangiensis]
MDARTVSSSLGANAKLCYQITLGNTGGVFDVEPEVRTIFITQTLVFEQTKSCKSCQGRMPTTVLGKVYSPDPYDWDYKTYLVEGHMPRLTFPIVVDCGPTGLVSVTVESATVCTCPGRDHAHQPCSTYPRNPCFNGGTCMDMQGFRR